MDIKNSIYQKLTTTQRTAALLDAIKRQDGVEICRLMADVPRKSYDMPETDFTDGLIFHALNDPEITDKAGVYKMLQSAFDRKESDTHNTKLIVQWIDENGMVYDHKTGTKKLADGITNPEFIERYKRWKEYEATQTAGRQ